MLQKQRVVIVVGHVAVAVAIAIVQNFNFVSVAGLVVDRGRCSNRVLIDVMIRLSIWMSANTGGGDVCASLISL